MGDYRDLVFYQKAREVVKGINDLTKAWPKTMQAHEISRQVLRSAMSVGANIAEGHGRHEGAEYIHYLLITQGSANETDYWLRSSVDVGLNAGEAVKDLIGKNYEVRRMLVASINLSRSKRAGHNTREEAHLCIVQSRPSDE